VVKHPIDSVMNAVVLFASTDLDDLFVLIGFFADPKFKPRQVIVGQFLGIALLCALSWVGSLVSLVVSPAVIGLLGIVPIVMGCKKLWSLRIAADAGDLEVLTSPRSAVERANVAAVFLITIANGGDNLSVYIPVFAMRTGSEVAIIAVVFAVMTAIWLGLAHWLTRHRLIGTPLRRVARLALPFVLILLGVWILYTAGTVALLPR
jgi:cadmium resistance protein CadD (predicted permease)